MRAAVVGHCEWLTFMRVARVPAPGEIVFASRAWEEPAGGGATAAGEMARIAGGASFYTRLGNDATGAQVREVLGRLGVAVRATTGDRPQPRGFVFLDDDGERTISITAPPLGPCGADDLPWDELDQTDAVYFCKGDVAALRHARRARVLVAPARIKDLVHRAGVRLDVLCRSGSDPDETWEPGEIDPAPAVIATTLGARGGEWLVTSTGATGRWTPEPLPGPIADAYGCGDSFAAALAFALGAGRSLEDALAVAAARGASALCRPGAHGG